MRPASYWNRCPASSESAGHRLVEMGCAIEDGGRGELGRSKARFFDPDKARAWIKNGGRDSVERYISSRLGQKALPFRVVK